MYDIPLQDLTFTVFDTETTGMSPDKGARLVELSAVRVKPGLILDLADTFDTLINPMTDIPYNAFAVHGISTAMVAGKPEAKDVLPDFLEYTRNTVVVAHNAKFDCSFIKHHTKEAGQPAFFDIVLDTVKLARHSHSGLKSYSLSNLIHHFDMDIPLPETYRHRALFDAAHTALLLTISIKKLLSMNICTLAQLKRLPKSPVCSF